MTVFRPILGILFLLFCSTLVKAEKQSQVSAESKNRKPSGDCSIEVKVSKKFDRLLTAEELTSWKQSVCDERAQENSAKCALSYGKNVDPKELAYNCFGEPILIQDSENNPVLENGPTAIEVKKNIKGDARTVEEANAKLKREIDAEIADFIKKYKSFSETCASLGGVAFSKYETSQPLPRTQSELDKMVPFSATVSMKATCHQKRPSGEFVYDFNLSVRYWK